MKAIIYDLELTVLKRQQYLAEIIEIGAVKVEDSHGSPEITDFFQSFVRPKHSVLNPETIAFTGILQEDIDRAQTFPKVIDQFIEWIGQGPYYLCAWGPDDVSHLIRHCNDYRKKIDWIKNHNDIQRLYVQTLNQNNKYQQIGLHRAMEQLNLTFEGRAHRAIHDAFNTAKVFLKIFPHITLEENEAHEHMAYTTRIVYQTGTDRYYPFAGLAQLLQLE